MGRSGSVQVEDEKFIFWSSGEDQHGHGLNGPKTTSGPLSRDTGPRRHHLSIGGSG